MLLKLHKFDFWADEWIIIDYSSTSKANRVEQSTLVVEGSVHVAVQHKRLRHRFYQLVKVTNVANTSSASLGVRHGRKASLKVFGARSWGGWHLPVESGTFCDRLLVSRVSKTFSHGFSKSACKSPLLAGNFPSLKIPTFFIRKSICSEVDYCDDFIFPPLKVRVFTDGFCFLPLKARTFSVVLYPPSNYISFWIFWLLFQSLLLKPNNKSTCQTYLSTN